MPDLSQFGYHFIVEPHSTSLSAGEAAILGELKPAAVMFRKRNFLQDAPYSEWLGAFRALRDQIGGAIGRDEIIWCIDHEGGRVIRPPEPITRFPYAARWGNKVAEVAEAMAVELESLGINLVFGPVADIHSNPANPVINERAFGRTADEVVARSSIYLGVMESRGMLTCAKHFPGHGDTESDSHFGLPILRLSREELDARELVPFKALVAAGVPSIMTAHILFPSLDPINHATVSATLLDGLLRRELSFGGAIIADAMGMAAVEADLESGSTGAKAINAGLDMFCVAGDTVNLDIAIGLAREISEANEQGEIAPEALQASRQRVRTLLGRARRSEVEPLGDEILRKHQELARGLAETAAWSGFELVLPGFE